MTLEKVSCIKDYSHIATSSHAQWFDEHPLVRNICLIICALLIDLLFLNCLLYYSVCGDSSRFVVAVIQLLLNKNLSSFLFKVAAPIDGAQW